ncbi:MAG: glycerate kinase [Chloroflexi bacterium]|jgi:glycerate 2-kinase|nr:glycerate kinase [Chloroflexota bacterium]MBT4072496.1 glycerate kinase [Chloroflexota bacterium]MBT4513944.1 glycerate kinase [Chloroflexota bacterium]
MKIVIAPQGFKGSLTALQIARSIETGVKKVFPDAETVLVPAADGGDGTLQALVDSSSGTIESATVSDPLGRPIEATWGAMGDGETAVIEMAGASGLALLALDELDPLNTTTYGTGELFSAGLDAGYRRFIVGIGGSATNDGGAGLAQSLGISLRDVDGNELPRGGAALANIDHVDMSNFDDRLRDVEVTVACDVNNPLCGEDGASAVFGPQKGASPESIKQLDAALSRFADVVESDLGVSVRERPGAGAAGGLGAGLMAFLNARLAAGVDIVLDAVGLDDALEDADLVITGEGQIDHSTIFNKTPVGIAERAGKRGIPVIAIAGGLGAGYQETHDKGIASAFTLVSGPMTLDEAIADTSNLLAGVAEEIMRTVAIGRSLKP